MDSGPAPLARPGMTRLVPIRPALGRLPRRLSPLPVALPVAGRADAVDTSRAGDGLGRRVVEHHHRPLALAGLIERGTQQPPIRTDRLVRGAEMLFGAVLDRAHRLAGPLV